MLQKFEFNMSEEEAAIQAGIASDPDNPEWTEEDFARAHPASEVVPELVAYSMRAGRYGRTRPCGACWSPDGACHRDMPCECGIPAWWRTFQHR